MSGGVLLPAALLALTLAALAWFLRGDICEYRRFKMLADSAARQARFRAWIAKLWLAFALPSAIGLVALGRTEALGVLPVEFAGLADLLPPLGQSQFLLGAMIGSAGGGVVVGALFARQRRRGSVEPPKTIGDIGALLPRNRPEVVHAAALSVTAGITEELLFRLFLPLLLVLVTGNASLAFGLAAVMFGAMHLYQGWAGVAGTTVLGLVMTFIYLATGSLAAAMVLHALIDLGGLVLRPVLGGAWRVSS